MWVTGAVNHDREVVPVSHIGLKLERSETLIRQVQEAGGRIRFLLPASNLQEVDTAWMERNKVAPSGFIPLSTLAQLEEQFVRQSVVVADPVATAHPQTTSNRRAWLPLLLLLAAGGVAAALLSGDGRVVSPPAPSPVQSPPEIKTGAVVINTPVVTNLKVERLLLSWRPIYHTQEGCDRHSQAQAGWSQSDGQQIPKIDAKQLCGIEVKPEVEGDNDSLDQLDWNLVLRVESGNRAHPITRLDGYSYSGKGGNLRWFVPLPDTLLSDIRLSWEVQLSGLDGGQWQQQFRQVIDYPYQW